MGHCYSLDLRVRVANFVEAGHSCRAPARMRKEPEEGSSSFRQR
jgi:hypothetical protein